MFRTGLSWLTVLLGLWIAAAPFVLGYQTVEPAFATGVSGGLAVAALALFGWLIDAGAFKWGRRRPAGSAPSA